ncbi:unnamed protein product [Absidia cylindrospora]
MTIGPNNNHSSHHASPWDFMTTNATPSSSSEAEAKEAPSSLAQSFQTKSPPDDFSHLSVSEILSTYKHDTDLMKHVLAAKAQEDRKTAEEFRQMEEARLRFRFSDFDMDDYQKMDYSSIEKKDSITSSPAYSHQHTSHMFTESSLQAGKQYDQHDGSPHLDVLLSSPPPILMDQDTSSIYMENQHHRCTESISVLEAPVVQSHDYHLNVPTTSYSLPSSLSPSFVNPSHFMSPSPNMGYNEADLKSTSSSCSSIEAHSLLADLPSPVKNSHSDNTKNSGTTLSGNKANKKKASSPSTSSKHRRGQSSTAIMPGFSSSTHVLRWAAPKKKRPVQPPIVNVNQEPQVPLDHGVVMNALRSKLMRVQSTSSSSDSIPSSSPPPPPSSPPENYTRETKSATPPPRSPPVDTKPTTGILFLDLNNKSNRRKKAS